MSAVSQRIVAVVATASTVARASARPSPGSWNVAKAALELTLGVAHPEHTVVFLTVPGRDGAVAGKHQLASHYVWPGGQTLFSSGGFEN